MSTQEPPRDPEKLREPNPTTISLQIAAMGGEGGRILTSWIVSAAENEGWPVQSTSIPGVAQRTGATTYYVEMLPRRQVNEGERWPVFALTPTPGFVDVVIATELLEAGRAIENGYVSPERTTLIASRHRNYTIHEKSAMADDRFPVEHILKAIDVMAARAIVLDLARIAEEAGSILNSVVFGVLAGSRVLPLAPERLEAAMCESGMAVEANLRGFKAGYDAVVNRPIEAMPTESHAETRKPSAHAQAVKSDPVVFPAEVGNIIEHAIARLTDYQDARYAQHYIELVQKVFAVDREAKGDTRSWRLTKETARYLALWMSYEDIMRVADLKTSRGRWRRIYASQILGTDDILRVTEFLKPGIEELASILPPNIGRRISVWSERHGRQDSFNIGLKVRTTSLFGFLLLRLLARLKVWRHRTFRFQIEMSAATAWLDCVAAATRIDYDFGAEVVECARIRKGYGATHRRGVANFNAIMTRVVHPAISEGRSAASRVAELRALALADPEGNGVLRATDELHNAEEFGTNHHEDALGTARSA